MKTKKGGTDMYCPNCKEVQTCKAIPVPHITADPEDYAQNHWYWVKHPDISWFQRGRTCLRCGHDFVTGEVEIGLLRELLRLRNALADVKANAENYIAESNSAASSLAKLNESLSILRDLKVYQSQ